MTRITFLFGAANRSVAAADWLAARVRTNAKVLVYASNKQALGELDRLLWTRSALAFVPHCHLNSPLASETPIVLTDKPVSGTPAPCLLNLGDAIPEGFSSFEEVVELISTNEAERQAGRERFRFYRDQGCSIESIDVSGGSLHE